MGIKFILDSLLISAPRPTYIMDSQSLGNLVSYSLYDQQLASPFQWSHKVLCHLTIIATVVITISGSLANAAGHSPSRTPTLKTPAPECNAKDLCCGMPHVHFVIG